VFGNRSGRAQDSGADRVADGDGDAKRKTEYGQEFMRAGLGRRHAMIVPRP
jgi:hypothetical protein